MLYHQIYTQYWRRHNQVNLAYKSIGTTYLCRLTFYDDDQVAHMDPPKGGSIWASNYIFCNSVQIKLLTFPGGIWGEKRLKKIWQFNIIVLSLYH